MFIRYWNINEVKKYNMNNIKLFSVTLALLLISGCHPDSEEMPNRTPSAIVVRSFDDVVSMRSAASNEAVGPVVFTGEDILWFNETTKELRFINNASNNPSVLNNQLVLNNIAFSFFIDDEYLFSSMIYASSLYSQIFNSLVFYYNIVENKFFLLDGYPNVSVLSNPQESQALRNENMQKISSEWAKFINQLKKEGRYRN